MEIERKNTGSRPNKKEGLARRQHHRDACTDRNSMSMSSHFSEAVKTTGKAREPGTIQVPASVDGRSTDCCWGPSRLALKETNDFRSSHPLEAILVPAPLYHRPHTIRDFSMNRSQRSVVIEYRVDYRRLDPSSKRGLPGEDLGPTREDD